MPHPYSLFPGLNAQSNHRWATGDAEYAGCLRRTLPRDDHRHGMPRNPARMAYTLLVSVVIGTSHDAASHQPVFMEVRYGGEPQRSRAGGAVEGGA